MPKKSTLILLAIFLFFFLTTSVGAQTASNASDLKQEIQDLREEKKAAVDKIKEDTKAMIQAKRDEFKARLQTIKDQRKKTLLERINTKLENINKKHTTRFSKVLTKMQAILDQITQSTIDGKILEDSKIVQVSIDTAKTAVASQSAKTYIIEITDELSLRLNAQTEIMQLRQDLVTVHNLVLDTKQKVQKLRVDLAIIKKGATSSANL
ncbi:MAG: hypothetical protein HY424_00560 [Candidatus Levybacteria bacterium]|nr:hypothetical protein [Candidatus Levybacteria bacterium]